jgi:hypothetical protein
MADGWPRLVPTDDPLVVIVSALLRVHGHVWFDAAVRTARHSLDVVADACAVDRRRGFFK